MGALACLFAVTVALPMVASSEERELETEASASDVVLVIDASGSMLLTDPLKLRYEGAKLLLQFLGKDDRLAVVSFSREASVVRRLQPFSSDQVPAITSEIEAIKNEGAYTDLLEAVKAGQAILDAEPRDRAKRVMVLLSDGKMEPDPAIGFSTSRTQDLVSNYLPELKAKEIKIHTLAFSDQADKALLAEIAGVTEGLNWFTESADEIHKSFADLFLAVKRPQVVPLTSKGFRVDDDVEEATFYVAREEGATLVVKSPRNESYTADAPPDFMTWFQGQRFDVITMKEPDPGDWQVEGVAANDGFATVLTNLKLVTDWPSIVRSEDAVLVRARLYEGEKPVSLPEMSGVIKYRFQIAPTDKISEPIIREYLVDDGTNGDNQERDGIFSALVSIAEPGEYRLTVEARAPTFQRSQQVPFRVRPRLVTLSVERGGGDDHGHGHGESHDTGHDDGHGEEASAHGDESHGDAHGDDKSAHGKGAHGEGQEVEEKGKIRTVKGNGKYTIRVRLSAEVSSFRKVDVKLTAKDGQKRRYELPLKRSVHDSLLYEFPAGALPADGKYLLEASLRAETKKHQDVDADAKPLLFIRTSEVDEKPSNSELKLVLDNPAEEPKEGFPFIQLLLVTLGNAGFGYFGLRFMESRQANNATATQKYVVPKEVSDLLRQLEERAALSTVDLNDPMFAGLDDDTAAETVEPLPTSAETEPATEEAPPAEAADGGEGE